MAAATPPRGESVSPSQGNNTAAGNLPGDQGQAPGPSQDMAASPTPDQSGSAGQSDMAQSDSAAPAVDPTVTAGVSDGSSSGFSAAGFHEIPVEMVLTDCRATPDAKLVDILKQHSQ